MVRRIFLLVLAGLSWCVGVAGLYLRVEGCLEQTVPAAGQQNDETRAQLLQLPYTLPGTDLVIEGLASYEGLYLEDGSAEEVADLAALVIRNRGDTTVEQGQILLCQAGRELCFDFFYLPPGAEMLVLDRGRHLYAPGPVTACRGWAEAAAPDDLELVTVVEEGMCTLHITNPGATPLHNLTLYFKNFDPESGIYLGGIAYEINIEQLLPGQTYTCCPWYYVAGESRILKIKTSGR